MGKLALRSIVVASDLSERSDTVVRSAAALAAVLGAELRILHAFELEAVPYMAEESAETTFPGRLQTAERALQDQIRRVVPSDVSATGRVVIETVYKAILAEADAAEAGVIVLGPHRRRDLADAILGSTADRVIRTASVPCLIVREGLSLPLRRVVAPVDLSNPARGALRTAAAWGAALGRTAGDGLPEAELRVVHVIPRVFQTEDFPFDRAVVGPELHKEVGAALQGLAETGGLEVREELLWGDRPGPEIVDYARGERADLIVMGTHGHGALRRALIGSVASTVARQASCPVLLVPSALEERAD